MNLIKYPDPFLKRKLKPFDWSVYDPIDLSIQMFDVMNSSYGIGLAASQVGVNARMFVMSPGNERLIVIDPEILSQSQHTDRTIEGCLSFDGLAIPVSRPTWIAVKFLNERREEKRLKLSGLDARCFLHELDHLNGITLAEKINLVGV